MSFKTRLDKFEEIVNSHAISISELKDFCSNGCPDERSRSLAWKLLLNYLPLNKAEWARELELKRRNYASNIDEFVIGPGDSMQRANDHPLSSEPDSQWATFFDDNQTLQMINKDCRRLCPDLNFFQQHTENPLPSTIGQTKRPYETLRNRVAYQPLETENWTQKRFGSILDNRSSLLDASLFVDATSSHQPSLRLKLSNGSSVAGAGDLPTNDRDQSDKTFTSFTADQTSLQHKEESTNTLESAAVVKQQMEAEGEKECHWEVVQRILFIYCKLNKSQKYVQGMNEVIGPLYYVFATDPDPLWRKHAECDTFGCFAMLMSEIQENFLTSFDQDQTMGINRRMAEMMELLKRLDCSLEIRLVELKLLPEFFAFRWLTLLLSQELNMADVIRLWDSLFSDRERFYFLQYVCCAILFLLKPFIMENEFNKVLPIVQKISDYPDINIDMILHTAYEFYIRRK